MARAGILLLLGFCGLAAAAQNYSSLQPPAYTITLSFNISGTEYNPLPCVDLTNRACLPQASTCVSVPNGDSVIIRWEGPAGAAGNTLSLMTCFSNSSAVDRPWRKANAVISKDKKCNVEKPFKQGLPTGSGSYVWTPGANTPPAIYNIQLLEVQANSDPTNYTAMGRSVGFFQIQPINSTPSWLLAMVGVFSCIGPLTLAGFFTWEKVIKKD
ncbi:hypothetical protein COHA_005727 [Chlorella ohadii]|uniref:High-affinity nitrate transporter n=1 Tax=Chlorella ohadii TaxID=2649997 RepID=A0AAD5H1F7_9CHLO|nr:hypothetical protein COHA_005727 [Chlorella ohadii]